MKKWPSEGVNFSRFMDIQAKHIRLSHGIFCTENVLRSMLKLASAKHRREKGQYSDGRAGERTFSDMLADCNKIGIWPILRLNTRIRATELTCFSNKE